MMAHGSADLHLVSILLLRYSFVPLPLALLVGFAIAYLYLRWGPGAASRSAGDRPGKPPEFKRRSRHALDKVGVGAYQVDPRDGLYYADECLLDMFEVTGSAYPVPREVWRRRVHPDDTEAMNRRWFEALANGSAYENEFRVLRSSGDVRMYRSVGSISRNEAGEATLVSGMAWDVTAEWTHRVASEEQAELFARTLEGIVDAVIVVDADQKLVYLNPAAAVMMDVPRTESIGMPLHQAFVTEDELTGKRRGSPVERCLQHGGRLLTEDGVLVSKCGRRYNIRKRVVMLEGNSTVITFQDITQERAAAKALAHAATHDYLTGLANRQWFEQELLNLWDNHRQPGRAHCLCVLDVDRFKVVNDTFGHLAGDTLLRQVVALLNCSVRTTDLVARMGGDEFVILLRDMKQEEAQTWAETFLKVLEGEHFEWLGRQYRFTASIGIVQFDIESLSRETLLSEADMAMFSSKRNGRNRVSVHRQGGTMLRELQVLHQIASALEHNRFELHAQPIVRVEAPGEKTYYELLLRMRDEAGDMVLPGDFLPVAEQHGLMRGIDRWVVRHALQAYSAHPAASGVHFAINLSGESLNDVDLYAFVLGEFNSSGVPPKNVTFEVTETGIIENLGTATVFLRQVRALGCRVALDDFGKGMSSLSYLSTFPLDFVKVDGSFVRNLRDNATNQSIVRATAQIAHTMHASTVGECVEDAETMHLLETLGVHNIQGWLTGRPRPWIQVLEDHERANGQGRPNGSVPDLPGSLDLVPGALTAAATPLPLSAS